jgi:Mn2+/Fe2+ NRAMP family transporter
VNFAEILLGVMTALGGFVDVGELVFVAQAGARYAYALTWVIALGTVGIIVYSEMAGRIAAVKKQGVFDVLRLRLSRRVAFLALFMATAVNLITCSAEIGGIATTLRLLFGLPLESALVIGTLALLALVAILPFQWIERTFGLLGLCMLVFAVATVRLGPDWGAVARGLVPQAPPLAGKEKLVFAYFVVGIFSSVMMAYEVYFSAAGGIEDGWKPSDTKMNTIIAGMGSALGSLLAIAILVLGKLVFQPRGIVPDSIDAIALATAPPLGKVGVIVGLLGILFAIAGAAAEVSLAGAYNYAQFFRLPWGRAKPLAAAPKFNLVWAAFLVAGMLVMMTGVDPVHLVEYSVIFSAVVLPLTYWPILRHASDRAVMGPHANNGVVTALGWVFLVLITLAALAGVPLMFLTHAGQG